MAGGPDDPVPRVWLKELEAVAKSVPLANHRINGHWTERKNKVQLHDLAQGDFQCQHG
ncbi:MAG: hypothetical protein ABSD89_13000 [Halobacteriota archaeon]